MYLGPAHRKSRYRQLMARVGRGDDIIGQFSTLLSGGKKGLFQWKEYVKYGEDNKAAV